MLILKYVLARKTQDGGKYSERRFLSYKPNLYEILYNISRQISQTWLFSCVALVIIGENVCFLFHKHIDVSQFEVYRAINSILNNNICNFINRYGVDFNEHFLREFTFLQVRIIKNSFCFWVNKRILSQDEGTMRMEGGKTVTYKYVMQPNNVLVNRYIQTVYNRHQIDLDKWSSLTVNPDQGDDRPCKRIRPFLCNMFCCISLN